MAQANIGSNLNLKEKVVLITGGSSGIEKGCALAFAAEGSFLAITGRNMEALTNVKSSCMDLGVPEDKVFIIQGDLLNDEDCKKVVDSTIGYFKKLDILVNSAGILISGSTLSISMEDYDQQMNINTRSPFVMTRLALPHIIKMKGNIVNISSVTGLRAFPNVVAYNMSKAALDQLTRTVALEVAPEGVRVNAVNPGVIITNIHKHGGMSDEAYQKFLEHGKTTHALGRVGEASEVAQAVVFLASDCASFITGATIPIDGGRSIMCPR